MKDQNVNLASKKSFVLYHDTSEVLLEMTDEDAGKLIKEIIYYSIISSNQNPKKAKKPTGLSGLLEFVAHPFKSHIDRDLETWKIKATRNKENGKKGGRPKKSVKKKPKKAVNGTVTVNGTVNVNVNEEIYNLYPRKIAKPEALKSITKALKNNSVDFLKEKTKAYAESVKDKDPKFIPHPSTWFNQERYNDEIEESNSISDEQQAMQLCRERGLSLEQAKGIIERRKLVNT